MSSRKQLICKEQRFTAGGRSNDKIAFSPLFYDGLSTSPFERENRLYPVEFDYKELSSISVTIEIPEGYIVESLPEAAIISFPDKSIKYIFSANQLGNKVQIISNLNLNRMSYTIDEYAGLQQLYQLMVSKSNEMIILKKAI
mgnify:CR=1 FL=1